jgi:TIR domain
MSNIDSIKKQLGIYERRLQILKEQRITFGELNVPPYIVIDIENIEAEMEKLQQQLPESERAAVSKDHTAARGNEAGSDQAQAHKEETEKEIFISYAWGGESEEIVNKLDTTFQAKGVTIIRDKRDLGYKGRIKAFMERIGRGKAVIVVVSEKYLRSENCMFELVQITKNGQFYERIFPIVLADANIYDPVDRIEYVAYWEGKIEKLDTAMRKVGSANLQGFREDIDSYTEIRHTIAELTNILKDMNSLTSGMHSEAAFQTLFQAVERKMAE